MKKNFRVGDRVKRIQIDNAWEGRWFKVGQVGTVTKVDSRHGIDVDVDGVGRVDGNDDSYLELVSCKRPKPAKIQPPRFILQYELDEDPFELFATEKEVRVRINELADKPNLKRDSIKVYEIKNVRAVKLGTSIKFTK